MSTYHQPGMSDQQPPAVQPPRKPRRWPWVLGIVTAFLVGLGTGSVGGEDTSTTAAGGAPEPAPTATVTVTAEPPADSNNETKQEEEKPAPAEEEATDIISAGTWVVGTDIEPGQYRTSGPTDEWPCYWARLSGLSGDFGEIITNGNAEGPTTLEVSESDEALEVGGTCEWEPVD